MSRNLNERKIAILLIGLFLVMSVLISSLTYDPEKDLADAVTNDIWLKYYSEGIFSLPYDEWTYGNTQSVVVWHDGEFQVVNEKAPGHALMMVPFYVMDVGFLFGPFMVALAVLATYMLGKRFFNWRVGAIAAVLVLTDVSVVMMWYRYYWTDASTMSLLVLSIWLSVEANYWVNGKSLDPRKVLNVTKRQKLLAIMLGAIAGLSFGASVSTRYATALILIPLMFYFAVFYLIRAWSSLKTRKLSQAIRSSFRLWPLFAVFLLGLMCILVPLMSYNSEYFGGPLQSGYDATTLQQFSRLGNTTDRDTSSEWISSSSFDFFTVISNFFVLLPVLVARMPFLLLVPIGLWIIRRSFPAITLLATWIAVNFYTYLSISWVNMYATLPSEILYEPRYFIPSVPAIALFAGIALDHLMFKKVRWKTEKKETRHIGIISNRTFLTALLALALILCSLVPATIFLAQTDPTGGNGPPQGQPGGPNMPQAGEGTNPGGHSPTPKPQPTGAETSIDEGTYSNLLANEQFEAANELMYGQYIITPSFTMNQTLSDQAQENSIAVLL
jgi:hypothetical protein